MSERKLFALIARRPDLSGAAFSAHWRQVHGPLALRMPALRRYVQNHVRPWSFRLVEPPALDGIAEAWFDDAAPEDGTGGLHTDPVYLDGARRDEPNFMDLTRHHYLRVDEHVVVPGAAGEVKILLLARRRAGTTAARFEEAWFGSARSAPGLSRCVRNAVTGWPDGTPRPAYDAVDELWWEDLDALSAAQDDPPTWELLRGTEVADTVAVRVDPVRLR